MILDLRNKPPTWPASPAPVGRLRHVVRSRIAEYPRFYLPFARWKYPGPSPEVISTESEFVIDGYTRSASTFAVYAFQLAQDYPVRLAHHLHAPAQLIAAAKMGTPALLVIREPKGAILSQLVREPQVTLKNALVAYARFHAALLPYRSSFVVAVFEEVTERFGEVMQRVNQRFGTSFNEFQHSQGNVKQCFELIKHRPTTIEPWRKTLLGFESGLVSRDEIRYAQEFFSDQSEPAVTETWVPSLERERLKEELHEQWLRPDLARSRERANLSYQALVDGA